MLPATAAPVPLPPAAPAPVPAAARLAYVWRHFRLAFPGAPAALPPRVVVADRSGGFFGGTAPYPAAPRWREWAGQRVPFFFDTNADELIRADGNNITISADIISAAFYLLSGWQEYFSDQRDRHGRFPYAGSVQQQYGFVGQPVVNYYFDVLRAAVEQAGGQPLTPRRWGPAGAGWAAFVSHDVDNLRSGWKVQAWAALRRGAWDALGRLAWRRLWGPDPWDNLEAVAAAVAEYGARSTFFILPEHRPAPDGTPNADYRLTSRLRRRLAALETQGHELALHGSLGTATDAARLLRAGSTHLTAYTGGNRFHYLSWEPTRTPQLLDEVGINFDSTLGFAEHFGFRHAYCHPFYPFNFVTGEATFFLEIPLTVMDTTLNHPNYLQLNPTAILPALAPVFQEVKKFGGVASLLWHNQNFDPANKLNGPRQFQELMRWLQAQGAAFQTGREIWQVYNLDSGHGA